MESSDKKPETEIHLVVLANVHVAAIHFIPIVTLIWDIELFGH